MMPNLSADFKEFTRFADDMAQKFPNYALLSAEVALLDVGDALMEAMPEYPPARSDTLSPPDGVSFLRTPKQRAWFFAAVRHNELRGWKWVDGHPQKVGGGRTGNLGRALTTDVETDFDLNTTFLEIGFDAASAPYAPWVVGPDYPGESINGVQMYQARVHVDVWWQFSDIMSNRESFAWKVFDETFWVEFSKRVNGGTHD